MQNIYNYMRQCVILFFYWMYQSLYYFELLERPKIIPTKTELSNLYIEKQKKRFLASYEETTQTQEQNQYNSNINPCFYDEKKYQTIVIEPDNELEKEWARRILIEITPRGNVMMYYDAFKQGFTYYSDNANIPYSVINAVVMKYVIMFRCRDFFMDDQVTPEDKPSPLLKKSVIKSEESVTKTDLPKSKAFAKLKNYNTSSSKNAKNPTKDQSEEKQYSRNKIIYAGKIANMFVLQKPKKSIKTSDNNFRSSLLDSIGGTQKNIMSYKDYKKQMASHEKTLHATM